MVLKLRDYKICYYHIFSSSFLKKVAIDLCFAIEANFTAGKRAPQSEILEAERAKSEILKEV